MSHLYLTLSIQSLYHGMIRLDVRCEGHGTHTLALLPPKGLTKRNDGKEPLNPRFALVHESSHSRLGSSGELILRPGPNRIASVSASIIDATDDSGWWSYPLMHGKCEVGLRVNGNGHCVVQCHFPKSIHPLPTESYLEWNGNPVSCSYQYTGYPDVHLAYIYEIPTSRNLGLRFVAKYREAEQVIAIPLGLPFVINVGVFGIGTVMGVVAQMNTGPLAGTLLVTRSAMVVAILPLYWALWNSSNVLRTIPTLVNLMVLQKQM